MSKLYPMAFRFDSETIEKLKTIKKVLSSKGTFTNIGVIRFLVNRYYNALVDAGVVEKEGDKWKSHTQIQL